MKTILTSILISGSLYFNSYSQCFASEGFLMWLCYGSLDRIDEGELILNPVKSLKPKLVTSEFEPESSEMLSKASSVKVVDIEMFLASSDHDDQSPKTSS